MFSIGQARTFGDEHPLLIEAHLLIEDVGDMTGRWMAMDFVRAAAQPAQVQVAGGIGRADRQGLPGGKGDSADSD